MDTIPEKMPPGQVMELVERSEAQIAAGQTVPLEPVLHRLRASIARVQGKQPANSNSHYDCGSQLSNRGNRQYEMKLLYWMAAASEGRQPLSITAKMRIAGATAIRPRFLRPTACTAACTAWISASSKPLSAMPGDSSSRPGFFRLIRPCDASTISDTAARRLAASQGRPYGYSKRSNTSTWPVTVSVGPVATSRWSMRLG